MFGLVTLTFLVSIIALIIGLIRPSIVLRWEKNGDKVTRKNVLKYFLSSIIISFILMIILVPDAEVEKQVSEKVSYEEEETEGEIEEIQKLNLSDREKDLLSKPASELDYNELEELDQIIARIDDYEEEDMELVLVSKDEILVKFKEETELKKEQEAKEKEEREAREEEDRKKREEEEAKAEQEKYNTGITVEDMARDKEGLKGSYVKLSGKILQVINGKVTTQYRMAVNDDYKQIIFLEIANNKLESNILEDDYITIEGTSVGNVTYKTVLGAEQTIPGVLINNFYY